MFLIDQKDVPQGGNFSLVSRKNSPGVKSGENDD